MQSNCKSGYASPVVGGILGTILSAIVGYLVVGAFGLKPLRGKPGEPG